MAVLIARCPHGIIRAASLEWNKDDEEVKDWAIYYTLELAESCTFNGDCDICSARIDANLKLIGLPVE